MKSAWWASSKESIKWTLRTLYWQTLRFIKELANHVNTLTRTSISGSPVQYQGYWMKIKNIRSLCSTMKIDKHWNSHLELSISDPFLSSMIWCMMIRTLSTDLVRYFQKKKGSLPTTTSQIANNFSKLIITSLTYPLLILNVR